MLCICRIARALMSCFIEPIFLRSSLMSLRVFWFMKSMFFLKMLHPFFTCRYATSCLRFSRLSKGFPICEGLFASFWVFCRASSVNSVLSGSSGFSSASFDMFSISSSMLAHVAFPSMSSRIRSMGVPPCSPKGVESTLCAISIMCFPSIKGLQLKSCGDSFSMRNALMRLLYCFRLYPQTSSAVFSVVASSSTDFCFGR
mmetsp:Transcript_777/g.1510  ORF Transcript_777/g.1510 Transcript_777/m.1510 type:complete len:200 (-) Transcript_777:440-1039(-)